MSTVRLFSLQSVNMPLLLVNIAAYNVLSEAGTYCKVVRCYLGEMHRPMTLGDHMTVWTIEASCLTSLRQPCVGLLKEILVCIG